MEVREPGGTLAGLVADLLFLKYRPSSIYLRSSSASLTALRRSMMNLNPSLLMTTSPVFVSLEFHTPENPITAWCWIRIKSLHWCSTSDAALYIRLLPLPPSLEHVATRYWLSAGPILIRLPGRFAFNGRWRKRNRASGSRSRSGRHTRGPSRLTMRFCDCCSLNAKSTCASLPAYRMA